MRRASVKGAIVGNSDKWIYDWLGMEATCPRDIEKLLDEANGEDVVVDINSGGGSLFAGVEIYSLIRRYKGTISTEIMGMAGSAASIIATAAYCRMYPPAMMMVHNTQGRAAGDYNAMDHESYVLKQANSSICKAYVEKTGKSEEELLEIMNRESWLTSDEAVEIGFADEIIGKNSKPIELYNSVNDGILPRSVIEKIRNTVKPPGADSENELLLKNEEEALLLLELQEVM